MVMEKQKRTIDTLPREIQEKLILLVEPSKRALGTLVKEFNQILDYHPNIKEIKDNNLKYNKSFVILYNRYSKEQVKPKNPLQKGNLIETQEEVDNQIKELKNPYLLLKTVNEVGKEGLMGEQDTVIVILIKLIMRFNLNAQPTSGNLVLSATTGFGKDEAVKRTLAVTTDKKDYLHKTSLSDKALLYFNKKYPDFNWNNKVLYLEDPPEETIISDSFRTLATGKAEASTVIDGEYVDLKIKGKPTLIVTSYRTNLDIEGDRRWAFKHTDESKELSKLVNEGYIKLKTGKKEYQKDKPNKNLRLALQTKLQPHSVVIPFYDELFKKITYIDRYSIKHLADYISASTILHQYQREKDEYGNLKATWFDYDVGLFVFYQVHDVFGKSLNVKEKELIDTLLNEEKGLSFSEIEEKSKTLTYKWISRNYEPLKERGIVKVKFKDVTAGATTKPAKSLYLPKDIIYLNLPYSDDFSGLTHDNPTIDPRLTHNNNNRSNNNSSNRYTKKDDRPTFKQCLQKIDEQRRVCGVACFLGESGKSGKSPIESSRREKREGESPTPSTTEGEKSWENRGGESSYEEFFEKIFTVQDKSYENLTKIFGKLKVDELIKRKFLIKKPDGSCEIGV